MVRFVEDATVVMGHGGEPATGVVLARGPMMTAMLTMGLMPSKMATPVYRRLPAPRCGVRVREWFAFADSKFWISSGYLEWSRLEWMALWCHAMRNKLRGIPRAIIVRR